MSQGGAIVVTGAARGIGRAAVERLARRGPAVVAVDRDPEALQRAAEEISADLGRPVVALAADVTDEAAVTDLFDRIGRMHGGVSVLVNSVGITGRTGIRAHEVPTENFEAVYAVNLRAAFLLTRAVLPMMLEAKYGRILHLASIAGKEGNAGMLAYSATKAGLIGLVKSAAKDYADTGITINALAPAVILTDLVAAMPPQQVRYMTDRIPMARTGTLEEASAMIDFITSPDCGFTTGFTFDLSGGRATY